MTNKLKGHLAGIGKRLIGGFDTKKNEPSQSKHVPHQGSREAARRLKRLEKSNG